MVTAAPKRFALTKVAVAAFAAMCVQDLLSTCMVVMEAHYNAVGAGLFDVAGWVAWLASSGLAVESIIKNGWRTRRSLTIIAAISVANLVGTIGGVMLGRALA